MNGKYGRQVTHAPCARRASTCTYHSRRAAVGTGLELEVSGVVVGTLHTAPSGKNTAIIMMMIMIQVQCCFTSTETMRTVRDRGDQDGHLDVHTASGR